MRDRLEELGKLELLETPVRKVLAYYTNVGTKSDQDLHQRARAHMQLSDVLASRGDRDGAWAEASAGHVLRQALLALAPGDVDRVRSVATSQDRLGELLAGRGDPAGARRAYETSLALVERIVKTDPAAKRDLFVSMLMIGASSADMGDLSRAVADLTRAKQLAEELAAGAPTDRDARRDLMVAHQRLGLLHKARGALPAALDELRAGLALSAPLLDETPDGVEAIRDHALNHDLIAYTLLAQGDPQAAMIEIRASRALAARLVEREPANLTFQRTLLTTRDRLVEAMTAAGDLAGARTEATTALELAVRIAAADPTNLEDQRAIEVSTNKLGQQLLAANQPAQALERFRAGYAIAKELAARDPRPPLRRDLAFTHRQLAEAAARLGDTAMAEASLRAAIATLDELVVAEPTMFEAHADLARTHQRLAALLDRRAPDQAARSRRTAAAIVARLVAHDPAAGARSEVVTPRAIGSVRHDQRATRDLPPMTGACCVAPGIAIAAIQGPRYPGSWCTPGRCSS
jgi:tetratricopeptide (TPR) repeat protein